MSSKSSTKAPQKGLLPGEWRPDYPVTYAPIFNWPPQPINILKWFFGWPGFLYPWNLFYISLTYVCYTYFQPPASAFTDLYSAEAKHAILSLYIRNAILLIGMAGGWHLVLYTLRLQGNNRKYFPEWPATNEPKFLFGDQVYDNIFWNLCSGVPIWTAYEVFYFWSINKGTVPTIPWDINNPYYFIGLLILIPFWREFHFYWIHRLIHTPFLYKHVHYLHHKNWNTISWSGMSMHPVEHVFYFSCLLLHWVVPSHPFHFLANAFWTSLTPAQGHSGFEQPFLGFISGGSYFHYLHHRYRDVNMGESTIPLDYWFGTFYDGQTSRSLPDDVVTSSSNNTKKR